MGEKLVIKFRNQMWAASVVCALFVARTQAAIVIFNTGVNSLGQVLPDGSPDQHYVGAGPSFTPVVHSNVSATPAPDTLSAWLAPSPNVGAGSYTYQNTFSVLATDVGNITITGQWSAAASGVDISLNNVSSGQSIADPGNLAWHPFTISGPVTLGNNQLNFIAGENFTTATTGLRVEIISITTERASLALIGIAVLTIPTRRRIRHQD